MLVVLEVELEHANRLRFPAACGWLEAEAGRVDNRDDCHGHAAVGQVDAASASVVLNKHAQIVLVVDLLGVAGSLETSHHERILLGDSFHNTVLLLLLGDFIADIVEVELHIGGPLTHAGMGTLHRLIDEANGVGMRVVTGPDGQLLLDIEAHTASINLASGVVNVDLSSADLSRHELILLELAPHSGVTLITAAPRLDVASLLLLLTHLEGNGLLTDDEDLLVLHQIVVARHDCRFHVVLDLSLRLLLRVLILECERRGNGVRKSDLEVDLVDAGVDDTTLEVKHSSARVEERLAVLTLLLPVDNAGLVTVLLCLGVVTDEATLFGAFEVELDVTSVDLVVDLHVNLASDGVAWLIERQLCLELNFTVLEVAPVVREEEHRITRLNLINYIIRRYNLKDLSLSYFTRLGFP